MAEVYWIDLGILIGEISKERFSPKDYWRLEYGEACDKIHIQTLLKEIRINHPIISKRGEIEKTEHPLYFPLLLNYLAVIEKEKIPSLLTVLFKTLTNEKQKLGYHFLVNYHEAALLQYANTVPNIKTKLDRLKSWIKLNKALYKEPQSTNIGEIFFTLEEEDVDKVVEYLLLNKVIEHDMEEIVIQFLNNRFNNTLKVDVKKNRLVNLLFRLSKENLQKSGVKVDFVRILHNKILFKTGETYEPVDYEYFYRLLTDNSKKPTPELMLMSNFRP